MLLFIMIFHDIYAQQCCALWGSPILRASLQKFKLIKHIWFKALVRTESSARHFLLHVRIIFYSTVFFVLPSSIASYV